MKISFISTMAGAPWGGSEELWYRTALLALTEKNDVAVYTYEWKPEPAAISELRNKGAAIHTRSRGSFTRSVLTALGRKTGTKFYFDRRFYASISDFLPDVILISQGATLEACEDRQLDVVLRKLNRPFYLISQWNSEWGGMIEANNRKIYLDFINAARAFFFVSDRNRITAERQLAESITNHQLICNPVKINNTLVKRLPVGNTLKMACVARLDCLTKGQDILLQTLADARWLERDFHLSFYGKGPHEEYLHALISHFGLSGKVSLKGHVSNIDLIWQENHVLVLPSLSEGTPLSMVEAMLSGRAVVGTNVGDIGRYVIDGQNGFLADVASPESLASALENLWTRKHELEDLGKRAHLRATELSDPNPQASLYKMITIS